MTLNKQIQTCLLYFHRHLSYFPHIYSVTGFLDIVPAVFIFLKKNILRFSQWIRISLLTHINTHQQTWHVQHTSVFAKQDASFFRVAKFRHVFMERFSIVIWVCKRFNHTRTHTRAHKPMFKFLQYVWTCLDKHNQQQSSRSVTHAFSSTLPRFSPLCSSQKQVHVHTHECLNRARTLWCWRTRTTHGTSDLEKTSSKQSTAVIDCIRSEPQLITVGFGGTSHTVLNL